MWMSSKSLSILSVFFTKRALYPLDSHEVLLLYITHPKMSSARVHVVLSGFWSFPVTVEMSDWQLIPSYEQHLQCTFVLALGMSKRLVAGQFSSHSAGRMIYCKWTVLITERHFEMGLHQAVIKGECLYNRGVCLGALLKLLQSQHPICILIHHIKDAVNSFLWCVFLLR